MTEVLANIRRRCGLRAGYTDWRPIQRGSRVADPSGAVWRFQSVERHDFPERLFGGATGALHGTQISTDDRLWLTLPAEQTSSSIF
jgi:hypothetical protein